jgi:hypothetical protein
VNLLVVPLPRLSCVAYSLSYSLILPSFPDHLPLLNDSISNDSSSLSSSFFSSSLLLFFSSLTTTTTPAPPLAVDTSPLAKPSHAFPPSISPRNSNVSPRNSNVSPRNAPQGVGPELSHNSFEHIDYSCPHSHSHSHSHSRSHSCNLSHSHSQSSCLLHV